MFFNELINNDFNIIKGEKEKLFFRFFLKPWEATENDLVFIFDKKYLRYEPFGIVVSDSEDILISANTKIKILIKDIKKVFFNCVQNYTQIDPGQFINNKEEYFFIEKGKREKIEDAIVYGPVFIHRTVKLGKSILRGPLIIEKEVFIGDNNTIGGNGFGIYEENIVNHRGGVWIKEKVYIANQCNIDRSVIGWTYIGKNTFLDSMVHVAHNVKIGTNTIIAGQSGIAGSVIIGNNVQIGGQSGVNDGLIIENDVKIGGKSKVTRDLKKGMFVVGNPAKEIKKWSE